MKQIKLNRTTKIVLMSLALLVLLVGCTSVVDPETGKVLTDQIIGLDTPWNLSELGLFSAILIWPMAQIVNLLSSQIGVTLAIIVITLAINAILTPITVKSTITTQRMQMIAPEQQKIQEKYKDKTDQQSQLRMGQEMQNLYKKYDIKMSAMFTPMLLQLPLIIAVWQALQRSEAVINGSLFGYSLALTPKDGMAQGIIFYFVVFGLMVVCQAIGVLGPQWLSKRAQKKLPVYKQSTKPQQGKGMMIFMLVFISWIGLTLVSALCIYLAVSSLARFVQTWYIQNKYVNVEPAK